MDEVTGAVPEAVARRAEQDEHVLPVLRLIADLRRFRRQPMRRAQRLPTRVNAERLAARRAEFRSGAIETATVRQLLGDVSRQAVAQRVARHRLLAAEIAGRMFFPDWQFGADGVRPGVDRIVGALHADGRSALQADVLMRTPVAELGGRTPADLVAAGRLDDAQRYVTIAGGSV